MLYSNLYLHKKSYIIRRYRSYSEKSLESEFSLHYSSDENLSSQQLFNDGVFQGVDRPYRQRKAFSGIGVQSTAIRCPDLLVYLHMHPPLDKIGTVIIETDIKKVIGPSGINRHFPPFHFLPTLGTQRSISGCHFSASLSLTFGCRQNYWQNNRGINVHKQWLKYITKERMHHDRD